MTPFSRVVVVGASVATGGFVSELREQGYAGDLVVVEGDDDAPYDRPPLSKDFLGTDSPRPEAPWWDERCELLRGRAAGIDIPERTVRVASRDGSERAIGGDHLVIATGSVPMLLPDEPAGVAHLRTAADARHIREQAQAGASVVILGAGTIGTELASTLQRLGCAVTVVDLAAQPLQRFLAGHLGEEVSAWIREGGVDLRLETPVLGIKPTATQWQVLTPAESLTADLVVSAIGTRPTIEWLTGSGLDLRNGVQCDEHGMALTADGSPVPHVHAIGDVAAWAHRDGRHQRHEDWTMAGRQGRHLARHLLGLETTPIDAEPAYFWSQQFGRRLQVLGTLSPDTQLVEHHTNPERKSAYYTMTRDGRDEAWIAINSPRDFALAMREAGAGRS